jgi:hypothetical protein
LILSLDQPVALIPEYFNVNAAQTQTLGYGISGAGRLFLRLVRNGGEVSIAMQGCLMKLIINTNAFVSTINQNGPKLLGECKLFQNYQSALSHRL